jgi:alginate O-acetyltransferase complex protein AlgI
MFQKINDLLTYHQNEPLIFSTGLFLFLFAFFLIGFQLIYKKHISKIIYTVVFSLFFYYKSSGWYFLVLVGSTLVDYFLANLIFKSSAPLKRKAWLVFSLLLNLGLLAYFKYTNFLYESFCYITSGQFHKLDIFLPVGVSFFTFQSLSYTLDIYRDEIKPVKNILDYAFFVSFFPQLVAGPIVRAKEFIPQITKTPLVTKEMLGKGVFLICIGLFKKSIVSDYISINFVDRIFENPMLYSGIENLLGVYGYALQIYCDFSGYSDMAIGIALLFGFHLSKNFDSPYQSLHVTEFWRRWHISLSSWLRDYLYISLGGSRKGKIRTYINLMLTMLIGGLWHGAGVKFILWGGMHGAALVIHKIYIENKEKYIIFYGFFQTYIGNFISWFITFNFICFCWIFFRAADMSNVEQILNQIVNVFNVQILPQLIMGYPLIIAAMLIGYIFHLTPNIYEFKLQEKLILSPLLVKSIVMFVMIFLVIQTKSSKIVPFIYFQF